jgi:plastocyanin domain-containing protein
MAAPVLAEDPDQKIFTALTGPDGIQKVSITGGEYFFEPNHIIVKINVPVELSVKKNAGFVPHNISMNSPEAGMKFEESLSSDATPVRFTPSKTGSYPFLCSKKPPFMKSHADRGMKGIIEVVD